MTKKKPFFFYYIFTKKYKYLPYIFKIIKKFVIMYYE